MNPSGPKQVAENLGSRVKMAENVLPGLKAGWNIESLCSAKEEAKRPGMKPCVLLRNPILKNDAGGVYHIIQDDNLMTIKEQVKKRGNFSTPPSIFVSK